MWSLALTLKKIHALIINTQQAGRARTEMSQKYLKTSQGKKGKRGQGPTREDTKITACNSNVEIAYEA